MRIHRKEMVRLSEAIAYEYGGNLTVRQLYYQLVARGHIANSQKEYKRLVSALSDARKNGVFPLDLIIDRTRRVIRGDFIRHDVSVECAMDTAQDIVSTLPERLINIAKWMGQPNHVSVWVEKEALAGVFEGPCAELGVSMFVCRGYPSISSLYEWARSVNEVVDEFAELGEHIESINVLYFGDHDPDGWEIPRAAERTIRELCIGEAFYEVYDRVRFERVALNMDQIERLQPPPFPAKVSSSRYQSYVDEHETEMAWELDALSPPALRELIRSNVERLYDDDIAIRNIATVGDARREMRELMRTTDWQGEI